MTWQGDGVSVTHHAPERLFSAKAMSLSWQIPPPRHGATPTAALTHIALQEHLEETAVDQVENIIYEQYQEVLAPK